MTLQIPVLEAGPRSRREPRTATEDLLSDRFRVETFVANFEALATAARGAAALRRLILELAVRGRLTSPTALAQAADGPFPIPEHWAWGSGEEVFAFVTSGSRGWAAYYAADGPLFLRIGNLDYETTDLDLRNIQHVRPPKNAEGVRTRVEAGDILISITGDTGMVGLAPPNLGEAYINQHIALARPSAKMWPAFVAHALTAPSLLGRLQSAQRGIKNSLGLEDVRKLSVPVPPLAEQKRIVARVDQLMALVDDLEAKQTKKRDLSTRFTKASLEALTTADSSEAFDTAWQRVVENLATVTDRAEKVTGVRRCVVGLALRGCLVGQHPSDGDAEQILSRLHAEPLAETERPSVPLPKSWRWAALGSVLTDGPKNGFSPKAVDHETPVKSLTLTATTSGNFDGQFFKYIAENIPPDSELWLHDGDVLIQRGNTIEYVGVAAIYRGPSRTFIYPDLMMKVRISEEMDLEFVHMALNSPVARAFIMSRASGTSGSMPKINQATLRAIPIPVAPLAEQRRVMRRVNQLMKLCDDLEARLHRAEDRASKLVEAVVQEMVT